MKVRILGQVFLNDDDFPKILAEVRKKITPGLEAKNLGELFRFYMTECDYYVNTEHGACIVFGSTFWIREGYEDFLRTISPWVKNNSRLFITYEELGYEWLFCWKDHRFYKCLGEITYKGDPYAKEKGN